MGQQQVFQFSAQPRSVHLASADASAASAVPLWQILWLEPTMSRQMNRIVAFRYTICGGAWKMSCPVGQITETEHFRVINPDTPFPIWKAVSRQLA